MFRFATIRLFFLLVIVTCFVVGGVMLTFQCAMVLVHVIVIIKKTQYTRW